MGGHIGKNHPSFDARNFGFRRLSDLVRQQRYLECQEMAPTEGSTGVHLQVRLKS